MPSPAGVPMITFLIVPPSATSNIGAWLSFWLPSPMPKKRFMPPSKVPLTGVVVVTLTLLVGVGQVVLNATVVTARVDAVEAPAAAAAAVVARKVVLPPVSMMACAEEAPVSRPAPAVRVAVTSAILRRVMTRPRAGAGRPPRASIAVGQLLWY